MTELREQVATIIWEKGKPDPCYSSDHVAFIETRLNGIPLTLKVEMEYRYQDDYSGKYRYENYKFRSIFITAKSENNEVMHLSEKFAKIKTAFIFLPIYKNNQIVWLTFEDFQDYKPLLYQTEDDLIIALYEAILSGKFKN